MQPGDMEELAGVRLASGAAAWKRLAAFAERVSRNPPEVLSGTPAATGDCPLRADREGGERALPPIDLERVAPEHRNGLLLVPRVL